MCFQPHLCLPTGRGLAGLSLQLRIPGARTLLHTTQPPRLDNCGKCLSSLSLRKEIRYVIKHFFKQL